jgi:uncharacterized Zn-finger protein
MDVTPEMVANENPPASPLLRENFNLSQPTTNMQIDHDTPIEQMVVNENPPASPMRENPSLFM